MLPLSISPPRSKIPQIPAYHAAADGCAEHIMQWSKFILWHAGRKGAGGHPPGRLPDPVHPGFPHAPPKVIRYHVTLLFNSTEAISFMLRKVFIIFAACSAVTLAYAQAAPEIYGKLRAQARE